jgi:outer membrane protein assembly factor BamD
MAGKARDSSPKVVGMFRRVIIAVVLVSGLFAFTACSNKRVTNPIADVDSKQPDKVLFDRAMEAMKRNKFEAARLALQTLINTYPDSEYVARAKLSIADSWYAEGGSAAWQQAEAEYLDFQTFFPNMPEAAEAQLKVANIHYQQMEKPDRDFTHAKRAEDEYRKLLMNYPDNQQLVPLAKKRLLEVQEVLAEREFRIGRFYFLRESWAAAIARLKSVADAYPLFSGADETLFMIGSAYERQADFVRAVPTCVTGKKILNCMGEAQKGRVIEQYTKQASDAYSKILTRYPVMARAADAKGRLEALKLPVPTATPEIIAQNKAEEESRLERGMWSRMMLNFVKRPDVLQAAKVGEPTLIDAKQTNATDIVKSAMNAAAGSSGTAKVGAEVVKDGEIPQSQPIPRSDAQPATEAQPGGSTGDAVVPEQTNTGTGGNTEGIGELVPNADAAGDAGTVTASPAGSTAPQTAAPTPVPPNPAPEAAPPANDGGNPTEQTPTPPAPVNEIAVQESSSSETKAESAEASSSETASQGTSSSKAKKKRKIWPF